MRFVSASSSPSTHLSPSRKIGARVLVPGSSSSPSSFAGQNYSSTEILCRLLILLHMSSEAGSLTVKPDCYLLSPGNTVWILLRGVDSLLTAFQARRVIICKAIGMRAYQLEKMGEERWLATTWRTILPCAAVLVSLQCHARALTPYNLTLLLHLEFGWAADIQVHFTACHATSNPPSNGRHQNWNVESIHQGSHHRSEAVTLKSQMSSRLQSWAGLLPNPCNAAGRRSLQSRTIPFLGRRSSIPGGPRSYQTSHMSRRRRLPLQHRGGIHRLAGTGGLRHQGSLATRCKGSYSPV